MEKVKEFHLNALPAIIEPGAKYFIRKGDMVTLYVGNREGTAVVPLDGAASVAAAAEAREVTAQALAEVTQMGAEALALTGIDPAYISETTADPPAAPAGTRGAKRTESGGIVRLESDGAAWQTRGEALPGQSDMRARVLAHADLATLLASRAQDAVQSAGGEMFRVAAPDTPVDGGVVLERADKTKLIRVGVRSLAYADWWEFDPSNNPDANREYLQRALNYCREEGIGQLIIRSKRGGAGSYYNLQPGVQRPVTVALRAEGVVTLRYWQLTNDWDVPLFQDVVSDADNVASAIHRNMAMGYYGIIFETHTQGRGAGIRRGDDNQAGARQIGVMSTVSACAFKGLAYAQKFGANQWCTKTENSVFQDNIYDAFFEGGANSNENQQFDKCVFSNPKGAIFQIQNGGPGLGIVAEACSFDYMDDNVPIVNFAGGDGSSVDLNGCWIEGRQSGGLFLGRPDNLVNLNGGTWINANPTPGNQVLAGNDMKIRPNGLKYFEVTGEFRFDQQQVVIGAGATTVYVRVPYISAGCRPRVTCVGDPVAFAVQAQNSDGINDGKTLCIRTNAPAPGQGWQFVVSW